jgi:apolipoprotein N-acyltransferase
MNIAVARAGEFADLPQAELARPARYMLAALTGCLIFLPWLDARLFVLTWVAFVPLLFALERTSLWEAYLLGALAGLVWCAGATYWMVDFVSNLKAYHWPYNHVVAAAFWVYIAQLVGMVALLYTWLRRRAAAPDVLLLPVAFVALFSLYPMLFHTRLAEAQVLFLPALQGVDLVGAHGLDFVIVLSSAFVYRLLRPRKSARDVVTLLVCALVFAAWFGYGLQRLHSWDREIAGWPTRLIGMVQPNDAVSITLPPPQPGYTREYPVEMAATERLVQQGAEVVFWPEARYKGYFQEPDVRVSYQSEIAALGAPLIFHDLLREEGEDGVLRAFNTAVHVNEHGALAGTYRKMKIVPFGEYLPPFWQLPGIRVFTSRYLGDFLRPIQPGTEHTVFEAAGMPIVPKLCYETAFPAFVAEAIGRDGAGHVLAFLSMDNWFGQTRQPYQHMAASVVRGVENRVPMVHAINNGPSVVALPTGRLVAEAPIFEAGAMLVAMPHSPEHGGSVFSRHPHAFLKGVYALLIGLTGVRLRAAWLARRPARAAAA